jgi:hypothetical protein
MRLQSQNSILFISYHHSYREFQAHFPLPKLMAHGPPNHMPPSWLLYSKRGYDLKADWTLIADTARGALREVRETLDGIPSEGVIKEEILQTFESEHQGKLLGAFNLKTQRRLVP